MTYLSTRHDYLQNWTYIRTDRHEFRQIYNRGPDGRLRSEEPFYLRMEEVENRLGTANGVQIRAEAWVTDYFYNNTQRGFCETRVINQTLSLRFVGSDPMVFKPGMPLEAQIAVRYHDQVALSKDKLEKSSLLVQTIATLESGQKVALPDVRVPSKIHGLSAFQVCKDSAASSGSQLTLLSSRTSTDCATTDRLTATRRSATATTRGRLTRRPSSPTTPRRTRSSS